MARTFDRWKRFDAARQTHARAALERMEQARDALEGGADPTAPQRDATAKLDDARDRLGRRRGRRPGRAWTGWPPPRTPR